MHSILNWRIIGALELYVNTLIELCVIKFLSRLKNKLAIVDYVNLKSNRQALSLTYFSGSNGSDDGMKLFWSYVYCDIVKRINDRIRSPASGHAF